MTRNLLLVILLSIPLLAGCASKSDVKTGTMPEFTTDLTFDDIPIPKGFKLTRSKSLSFQNDYMRVGRFVYYGREDTNDVLAFIQQQMPLNQWEPISYVDTKQSIRRYEKGDQECTVIVEKRTGWKNCMISIWVSPKSK
ncbi:MAG: hypothetical protein P9M00_12280 [Candidatus Tritonobacter lacicola]|nr:hypothetical protein [Candidatus Tritonobacter lacicola]